MILVEIKKDTLEETCFACPTQWEGRTVDGKYFYARYRFGGMSVEVDNELVFRADFGGSMDGSCSWDDFVTQARKQNVILLVVNS